MVPSGNTKPTNSYVVRAQAIGRHLVRSECNIRPAIEAKVPANKQGLDLGQHALASVLCSPSAPPNPMSILKSTLCEGAGLSNPSQHTSGAAPAPGGSALTASDLNLDTGLQATSQPNTLPGTPLRPRRVRYNPIVSSINTWGIENFEKESIRDFQKQKRGSVFRHETYSPELVREALTKTY